MKYRMTLSVAAVMFSSLTGLLLADAAHADVTVQAEQIGRVQPGMSADQVKALLGRPAQSLRFTNTAQHLWIYVIPGGTQQLEVHFSPDGLVRQSLVTSVPLY